VDTTQAKAAPGLDAGSASAGASVAGLGGRGLGRGSGRGLGPTDGPGAGLAGTGPGASGIGTGPGGGGPARALDLGDLLARIRQRIEAVKRYPEDARRDSIQGTVSVRFRVHADGQLERVELVRSSGSRVLDEASLETIRRAAPFPPVRGWVQVPLAYTLSEAER
jgi:protein TonB